MKPNNTKTYTISAPHMWLARIKGRNQVLWGSEFSGMKHKFGYSGACSVGDFNTEKETLHALKMLTIAYIKDSANYPRKAKVSVATLKYRFSNRFRRHRTISEFDMPLTIY